MAVVIFLLAGNTYRLYHQATIDAGVIIVTVLDTFCSGMEESGESIRFAFAFSQSASSSPPCLPIQHDI